MTSFCLIVLDFSLGAGPEEVTGVEFCTVIWEEFDLVGSEEMAGFFVAVHLAISLLR